MRSIVASVDGVRIIYIDDRNLEKSSCTCPFFLKDFTCKHVLGMLIRLQLCNMPREAKNVPFWDKNEREADQR